MPRLLQAAVSAVTSTREGPVRVQCGQQLPPAPRWPKPAGHPGWVRAALREEPTGVLPSHVERSVFRHAVRTGRRSAAPRRWQAGREPQWNPRTRTSALPQQHAGTLNVNIAGSIPRLISLPCPHPSSASDAPTPGVQPRCNAGEIATQVQRHRNAAQAQRSRNCERSATLPELRPRRNAVGIAIQAQRRRNAAGTGSD